MCSSFHTLAGDYLVEIACKNKPGGKRRAKQVVGVETTFSASTLLSHRQKIYSAKKKVSGPKYILALKRRELFGAHTTQNANRLRI